jgi:hypothetical protein
MVFIRRLAASVLLAILGAYAAEAGADKGGPQEVPDRPTDPAAARELEQKIEGILVRLGDDEWRTREAASKELAALGRPAAPLLGRHINHRDPEVAYRVRAAMVQIAREAKGAPGEAVEGLVLSAVQAGPPPQPGQCVTMWLTLSNATDHDVFVAQHHWRLHLQPTNVTGTEHSRVIAISGGAEYKPLDFLRLKPGQSVGYMMDADPIDRAQGRTDVQAYLEISLPDGAREALKSEAGAGIFSGSRELVSGKVTLKYDDRTDGADLDARVQALAAGPADGDAAAALEKDPRAVLALRRGLRRADEDQRWRVFQHVCRHPRPELEDDAVDFLGRWGPRTTQGRIGEGVRAFALGLPEERRLPFYFRMANARPYDWREVGNMVVFLTNSTRPEEQDLAARVFLMLYERGDRRPDVMHFVAQRLFASSDPRFRDPKKALEMARLAAADNPKDPLCQITLATLEGDTARVQKIIDGMEDAPSLNSMAWELATGTSATGRNPALALVLARKAVGKTPADQPRYPAYVDTLAAAQAASGDIKSALESQRKALAAIKPDDAERQEFADHLALYIALSRAGKDNQTGWMFSDIRFKGDAVRDALLEALNAETDAMLRRSLKQLLEKSYSSDPKVKAFKDATPVRP